jgi:hypothetical protein
MLSRGLVLFSHAVRMRVPPQRPPKKAEPLLWAGHDGVLEPRPFLGRGSTPAVRRRLANDARPVPWRR